MKMITKKICLLSLLACCIHTATASSYYSYRQAERMYSGMTITDLSGSDFVIGGIGADWDDAMRYQFDMAYAIPINPRVLALTGGYAYWEDRTYKIGTGRLEYDSFGVGFEGGVMLFPSESHEDNPVNFALYPYGRFGMAIQDAKLVNVRQDSDTYDGTVGGYKWELAVGLDARLQIAQSFYCSLGLGAGVWKSSNEDIVRVDEGDVTYIENVGFDGDDVFYRFSMGVFF
ncbi:MAG: hypothetical protein HRU15_02610 [Planctomycetes bacterium]|nr:hypothetical protein [Planctomycetota bacterium]